MKKISEKIFGFFVEKELQSLYLLAPVIFALGVITYFNLSFEPKLLYSTIAFLVSAIIALASFKLQRFFFIFLFIGFFVAGFFFANLRGVDAKSVMIEKDLGVIWVRADVKDITKKEKDITLVLRNVDLWQPDVKKFSPERTPTKIRVTVRTKIEDGIRVGDRVAFKAILAPPAQRPIYPDGYDFGKIAYFQKIGAVGYAISPIKLFEKKEANAIDRFQDYFYENVKANVADPDLAGIIVSQITADRVELSDEAKKNMQNAGLGHLIAISGLNMSVAMVWLFFLSRSLFSLWPRVALNYDTKKISVFICIVLGFIYLLVTGMPISAVRAFLMVLLFFIAVLFDRFSISLHPVAFAAQVILIVAPEQVLMPGFQLSFAAVIGLIGMCEMYDRYIKKNLSKDRGFIKKWLFVFFGVITTTIFTSLTTAPFGILHFGTFQNYGVFSNMIGVPVVSTLVLPFAFISIIAMPLGIEKPFLQVAEFGARIIRDTSAFISNKEGSVTYMADLPNGFIAFVVIGFLILFIFRTRIRFVGIPIILFGYYMLTAKPITPDFVINETGSLIALKQGDGGYKYYGINRKSFAQYQFNSKLGIAKPEFIKSSKECNKKRCEYMNVFFGKEPIKTDCDKYSFIFNLGKNEFSCDNSNVIASELSERGNPASNSEGWIASSQAPRNDEVVVIDRNTLTAKGTHLLYLKKNKLVTASDAILDRVWNNN